MVACATTMVAATTVAGSPCFAVEGQHGAVPEMEEAERRCQDQERLAL
jgi:hypothetical protein